MKPRTRQLLRRYPERVWRLASRRRISQLFSPEGLGLRFLRAAQGQLYMVTVVLPALSTDFPGWSPLERTRRLRTLMAECLADAPALYGNWELTRDGRPHFHALLDQRGVAATRAMFGSVHVQAVAQENGGLYGVVGYLLKPQRAAQVKQAIRLLDAGEEPGALLILGELCDEAVMEKRALNTQDGRRRLPNRLHDHALPSRFRPLTDREWDRLQPVLPQPKLGGRPPHDDRAILNAVLWRAHCGLPWREISSPYPGWRTCARRYQQWKQGGHLDRLVPLLPPRMRRTFDTGSRS